MFYIENSSTDAAFHFSCEEYFMFNNQINEPVIMLWQADKCVMLGNYQIVQSEIDMSYAENNGIKPVRRSSGGGTIFTDMGTLLCTLILPYEDGQDPRQIANETLAAMIVDTLAQIGIPAKREGRNDILVDGKKFSGMAQYVRNGRLCSHCSLLYDTDLNMLTRVLRVDSAKIQSKAIQSVRSRVTNLKEHMKEAYSTRDFAGLLKQKLFELQPVKMYTLTDHDVAEISRIYDGKYGNPSWTFESAPGFTFHNSKRYSGGKVEVYLNIVKGLVVSCSIKGDFLGTAPIRGLDERLENRAYQYQDLRAALDGVDLRPFLGDITAAQLLSCMFEGME